jgi:hypothetical protein
MKCVRDNTTHKITRVSDDEGQALVFKSKTHTFTSKDAWRKSEQAAKSKK